MTKKLVLLVMMFLGYTLSLMAQNISGKVVDEKNNPLPYVSLVLQSFQDSSYVGGVATNPEGLFTLPVKADVEYALSVSYIDYIIAGEDRLSLVYI